MAATPPPPSPFLPTAIVFLLAFCSLALLLLLFNRNRTNPRAPERQAEESPASLLSSVTVPSASAPPEAAQEVCLAGGGEGEERKKKKRGRKKKREAGQDGGGDGEKVAAGGAKKGAGADCLYPFSSLTSVTQRRIKHQYDQVVSANEDNALTRAQVSQFANCLIEARNELQQKSETIHRKFTISKALLFKADRSSFDRLCQQVYKLEAEQKRLEEDVTVYNRIQEQLNLSPAFKTMLELGACEESEANSDEAMRVIDSEFVDISFEELLAQEKKDSFWQENGKWRSCTK